MPGKSSDRAERRLKLIGKLFIRFLLGKSKGYSKIIQMGGEDYRVLIEPLAPPDADRWIRLLMKGKG